MIETIHFLILSFVVFTIGMFGVSLNRHNLIGLLMNIELMLIAVNINFIAFANQQSSMSGQAMVFFILAIAACEASVGLAIFVTLYRRWQSVSTDRFNQLKG